MHPTVPCTEQQWQHSWQEFWRCAALPLAKQAPACRSAPPQLAKANTPCGWLLALPTTQHRSCCILLCQLTTLPPLLLPRQDQEMVDSNHHRGLSPPFRRLLWHVATVSTVSSSNPRPNNLGTDAVCLPDLTTEWTCRCCAAESADAVRGMVAELMPALSLCLTSGA